MDPLDKAIPSYLTSKIQRCEQGVTTLTPDAFKKLSPQDVCNIWVHYRNPRHTYLTMEGVRFIGRMFTLDHFDFKSQPQKIQNRIIRILRTNPCGKQLADHLQEIRNNGSQNMQTILEVTT